MTDDGFTTTAVLMIERLDYSQRMTLAKRALMALRPAEKKAVVAALNAEWSDEKRKGPLGPRNPLAPPHIRVSQPARKFSGANRG